MGCRMKRMVWWLLISLFILQPMAGARAQDAGQEEQPMIVTSEARDMKRGDKGDDVQSLQARLKELQYYRGPVNGNYGDQTAAAVRTVQEAYGLKANGNADLKTLDIIYGEAYRPLKRNDRGLDVERLQTRLSELGYYWGQISGNYLDGTTAAIENFQRANGMTASGQADVFTQERLYGDDIVMPTPDPAATPTPVPAPTTPPDTSFPGRLWYGATGRGVEQVQRQLEHLGYFDRKVTGGYYKHTQASVKEFQRMNGLEQDGTVGEETWAALFAPDVVRPGGVPRPTAEPTPIPYFIEVDVQNQLIKVFRRDANLEFTDLYRVFTASTGTPSYPSDVGVWTLNGRKARWAEFPTWGGGLAQYWTRINPSIAFHSFLYTSDRRINMGSVNRLGRTASHGCIRLTIQDAKWIYDNIGAGTEVWIHEDAPPDPELKFAHAPGQFDSKAGIHITTPAPPQAPRFEPGTIPSTPVKELKVGSQGDDVYWLQQRLQELGFYQGTVTGQYREGTKAAVRAFQKDNKLSQSGNADQKTLELLRQLTLDMEPDHLPEVQPEPAFLVINP